MPAEVNILVKATDQASGVLGGIANTLGNITKLAAGVATAAAAGFVILGKQALDATAEYERMTLTIESLTARELMSTNATLSMADALKLAAPAAQETLKWIQQLAIASPFDMAGVQIAYRQALTYGFASDQAKVLTQNLVDFAAANGLTSDAMQTVSYALGQINNNDKVLMLDLRQLMQVGVPVLDILKEMGMDFEDVTAGAVKSTEFIAKFNEVMERDFGGAAKRQLATWTGLLNTFGDLKKMGLRELFGGMFDVLQPLVAKFAEWFQGPGLIKLREWGVELGNLTKNLVDFFSNLKGKGFEDLANMAGDFWVNFSADMLEKVRNIDWSGMSQALAEKIGDIDWNLLGQKLGAGLRNVFGIISTIVQEVDWGALFSSTLGAAAQFFVGIFGQTMEQAKRIVNDTLSNIKSNFSTAFSSIVTSLISVFASLPTMLAGIGAASGQLLMVNLANAIKSGINAVLRVIQQMVGMISNLLSSISIPFLGGGFSASAAGAAGSLAGARPASTTGVVKNRRASGGPVNPFGVYTVGENGPETLVMGNAPGRVLPNGAGGTININISSFLALSDMRDAEAKLRPLIVRAIRDAQGVI